MKCNTYLEEFKIDIVKQYLSGKQQKDLHAEYGLSKSTIYTWTYTSIQDTWIVLEIEF